jgi:hypothetical protein
MISEVWSSRANWSERKESECRTKIILEATLLAASNSEGLVNGAADLVGEVGTEDDPIASTGSNTLHGTNFVVNKLALTAVTSKRLSVDELAYVAVGKFKVAAALHVQSSDEFLVASDRIGNGKFSLGTGRGNWCSRRRAGNRHGYSVECAHLIIDSRESSKRQD